MNYNVVINHEEQYSIWPASSPCPEGWKTVGFCGEESECLKYIELHWLDLRPASVRNLTLADARSSESSTSA